MNNKILTMMFCIILTVASDVTIADDQFDLTGALNLTSEFRGGVIGVSISDPGVHIQPSLNLSHQSGVFLETWATKLQHTN